MNCFCFSASVVQSDAHSVKSPGSHARSGTGDDCDAAIPAEYQNNFPDIFRFLFKQKLESILSEMPATDHSLRLSKTYAAVILQEDEKDVGEVIVVASGSGTMDSAEWPPSYLGTVVHDCHAIVIARRVLIRYLYMRLAEHMEGLSDNGRSLFKDYPEPNGRWSLKDSVKLNILMSQPPCGAACKLQVPKVLPNSRSKGHKSVREFLAERKRAANSELLTKSCSEKGQTSLMLLLASRTSFVELCSVFFRGSNIEGIPTS